jgi:NTE family protein
VLGPGLARGFAHAGVLRALHEAKIPIGAIVGTELGGLIGALYAMNRTINAFEWSLLRFKDEAFVERGALSAFLGRKNDGRRLEAALAETFSDRDLGTARIPTRILVASEKSGDPRLLERGPAKDVLRRALARRGLIEPVEAVPPEETLISAAGRRPYPVSEARQLGLGPVIAVDVLASPADAADPAELKLGEELAAARAAGRDELKGADLVIEPDLSGMRYLEFQKRSEIAFRGKRETLRHLSAIRQLVGMPEPVLGGTP